jgi:phosphoribosylanthranilate isomerase
VSVQVKICGITTPAAFDACIEAAVDWIGFNFYPPSPRYITPPAAASLSARNPGGPKRVGLFVKPTEAEVADVLAAVPLDILQIYAGPDSVASLRATFGRPIWRSIGVRSSSDLPQSDDADGLVVEAPANPGIRPGGNARTFDWTILHGWVAPKPWLLAGGLNATNVGTALAATHAPAVDVSSGVERAPGEKSPELIRAFVTAARET